MSQDTPPWLLDMLRDLGELKGELRATIRDLVARNDRADRQHAQMADQLLNVSTQLAGVQETVSGLTETVTTLSQTSHRGPTREQRTLGGWVAHGVWLGASLPWRRIGLGAVVAATVLEHWLAPAGWLGGLVKWVAGWRVP